MNTYALVIIVRRSISSCAGAVYTLVSYMYMCVCIVICVYNYMHISFDPAYM